MRTLVLSLAAMILLSILASAQMMDRIERRSNQRTNERIDRKLDEKIDKGVDSGLEVHKNGVKKSDTDVASNIGVDVPDAYVFQHSVDMRYYDYDANGKTSDERMITLLFSDKENLTGQKSDMEGSKMFNIFDPDQSRTITMMERSGEKMGMVTVNRPSDYYDGESENSAPDMLYTPTGESKEISGYLCTAYKVEIKGYEENMTIWMTDAAEIDWKKYFAALYQGERGYTGMPDGYPEGAMIMMETEMGQYGKTSVMLVEQINVNIAEKVSTEGYTFIDMGAGR